MRLRELFFLPPMAVARLGESEIPVESFEWIEDPAPFNSPATIISPTATMIVRGDGTVRPYLPNVIHFKDGEFFRPVAPFFELWALLDGDDSGERPLTLDLLKKLGVQLGDVRYRVHAANLKAARRTGDPSCGYAADVALDAADHKRRALRAASPVHGRRPPLVLAGNPITLGWVQATRPEPDGTTAGGIDLSVLRLRFTPGRGYVYGPPSATARPDPETGAARRPAPTHEIVPRSRRTLNPKAAWMRYEIRDDRYDNPEPSDTYDGAGVNSPRSKRTRSLGIVDDSCDAIIEATLSVGGETFVARTRVVAAPQDFAPDRRPFVSLADELAFRELPAPPLESDADRQCSVEEVADLFARVHETMTLFNLDAMRAYMLGSNPNPRGIPTVQTGGRTKKLPRIDAASMRYPQDKPYVDDKLKGVTPAVSTPPPPAKTAPLDYHDAAVDIHGNIGDLEPLMAFLTANAARVRQLLRPPYGRFRDFRAVASQIPNAHFRDPRTQRDRLHDMRMPPYMRDADATALSITRRQYEQIMGLLDDLEGQEKQQGFVLTPVRRHVSRVSDRGIRTTKLPKKKKK